MSRRHEELNPAAGFNAMVIRKLQRGEAAVYRGIRIYALKRFAANFASTAAEARARPMAWYADRIETEDDPRHFIIGAFDGVYHDKLLLALRLD